MLHAHPEYRTAVLGGALLVVLIALVIGAVALRAGRPGRPTPSPKAATAGSGTGAGVAPTAMPTPAATPGGSPGPAITVGREFSLAYVGYDYHSGPPTGDAVKPYATQRLFWQLTEGGQDTAGNPAPWTAVSTGADEVVTATVVSAAGQLADQDDAAVQVVVSEHDTSSSGSWSGLRQEDLGLVRSGPGWLVDQVSQVSPEGS